MTDNPNLKTNKMVYFLHFSKSLRQEKLDVKCVTKCWKISLLWDISLALIIGN